VTPELVDKGTSSLPQVVYDMLDFFNIKDVKSGSNYDLGPYETGAKSWIPSSMKDKDRDSSDVIFSSAQSLYLSMSSLLGCFLLFIILL